MDRPPGWHSIASTRPHHPHGLPDLLAARLAPCEERTTPTHAFCTRRNTFDPSPGRNPMKRAYAFLQHTWDAPWTAYAFARTIAQRPRICLTAMCSDARTSRRLLTNIASA